MYVSGPCCGGPARDLAPPPSPRDAVTRETVASARSESSVQVTVETAEGDRVVLSIQSTAETEFRDYSSIDRGPGRFEAYRTTSLEQSETQSIDLTVDGNLNEQEVADINNLFLAIAAATAKPGKPVSAAGLDSIAMASYQIEQRNELEVSRTRTTSSYQPIEFNTHIRPQPHPQMRSRDPKIDENKPGRFLNHTFENFAND